MQGYNFLADYSPVRYVNYLIGEKEAEVFDGALSITFKKAIKILAHTLV